MTGKGANMEQIKQMLALMDRPAFCAEGDAILALNTAARSLALSPETPLSELLIDDRDAYAEFSEGCLTLKLTLPGGSRMATVTKLEGMALFTLEPETAEGDMRMLSLAAQTLRDPLTDVMALVEALPEDTEKLPELSRSLHRILRIVGNMTPQPPFRPETMELNALLEEIWDKAVPACEAKGIRFTFTPSPAPVYTVVDSGLLTRAVHNLLSNSMKFSSGREIGLELQRSGRHCRIRFRDPGGILPPDPFTRYLREPGLEDPRWGLGMGMLLVRSAAIAHGGTVLMTAPPEGGLLTELRLPIRQETTVRSPRRRISYTGERDPLLVELSDVLPPEFYE